MQGFLALVCAMRDRIERSTRQGWLPLTRGPAWNDNFFLVYARAAGEPLKAWACAHESAARIVLPPREILLTAGRVLAGRESARPAHTQEKP